MDLMQLIERQRGLVEGWRHLMGEMYKLQRDIVSLRCDLRQAGIKVPDDGIDVGLDVSRETEKENGS